MLPKRLAAFVAPLVLTTGITGAAFAAPPDTGRPDTSERTAQVSDAFSVLDAVNHYAITVSDMADQRAKSELVKNYAHMVATSNASVDDKIQSIAQTHHIEITPLNPQTEEGKSLLDRMKGETALLSSLQGDAWDKEYMTLVTNVQQSVLHLLEKSRATAQEPDVKQFFGDLTTTVQNRLKTAQDIMAKIYGDQV